MNCGSIFCPYLLSFFQQMPSTLCFILHYLCRKNCVDWYSDAMSVNNFKAFGSSLPFPFDRYCCELFSCRPPTISLLIAPLLFVECISSQRQIQLARHVAKRVVLVCCRAHDRFLLCRRQRRNGMTSGSFTGLYTNLRNLSSTLRRIEDIVVSLNQALQWLATPDSTTLLLLSANILTRQIDTALRPIVSHISKLFRGSRRCLVSDASVSGTIVIPVPFLSRRVWTLQIPLLSC